MLCDKKILLRLKGKAYHIVVTPTLLYAARVLAYQKVSRTNNEGNRNENDSLHGWPQEI